jgi:hypothetical protein
MKNNTKIRLHLSKQLFESLAKQVLAEAKKGDMSGGAYTEAVKAPKEKKEKAPEVKATDKMKKIGEMETRVAEKKHDKEEVREVVGPEMEAAKDLIAFLSDNAEFLATIGGITGAAKWIASKVAKDPEARKALDKATGAGSSELGGLGGKSFGGKD